MSVAVALLYALIAGHVVTVVNGPPEVVARDQLAFDTPAMVAYVLGAVLPVRYDRRLLEFSGGVHEMPDRERSGSPPPFSGRMRSVS